MSWLVTFVVLTADEASRDTVLSQAAAVPERGNLRIGAGGAVDTTDSAVGGWASWSLGEGLRVWAGAGLGQQALTSGLCVTWQLVNQSRWMINLAASLRVRWFDGGAGSAVDLRFAASRVVDRIAVLLNARAGTGVKGRAFVEAEGSLAATVAIIDEVRVGLEAAGGGILPGSTAGPDEYGRALQVVAGPVATVQLGPVRAQVLFGATWQRKPYPMGATARAAFTVDL